MTPVVTDQTGVCESFGGNKRARLVEPQAIIVHRFAAQLPDLPFVVSDAMTLAAAFHAHPDLRSEYSGKVYELVVNTEGDWFQWFPLRWYGAAAKAWNPKAVNVAVIGDFRKQPPGPAQFNALVYGVAVMRRRWGCPVNGHSFFPGAFGNPEKGPGGRYECPGELLDLAQLQARTEPSECRDDLAAFGLVT